MIWPRVSLLGKIWLSTSLALTALFAVMGYVIQRRAADTTARSLDEEVRASFAAYESLWRARAERLSSVTAILSSMPNVRGAFGTRDEATIRDAAREFWDKLPGDLQETALFFVTTPDGSVIASLGRHAPGLPREWPIVPASAKRFPQQVSGFHARGGELYQFVLTPVYVHAVQGVGLINVLVAGYQVNDAVAARLKDMTGGSDFLFVSGGRVVASTMNAHETAVLARQLGGSDRVSDGRNEYTRLTRNLIDLDGNPIGKLCIFRSFDAARQHIATLRRDVVTMWLVAVGVGFILTYLLVRRIVEPVRRLDAAAAEVARQNYAYRVTVDSQDELGRLAHTFNSMCASLQSARAELIRQERISTIGRLASSIVHDLRNPLAAIYGGAEILVDTDLPPNHVKRLAGNIYQASRRISAMLQDLANIARGKTEPEEQCQLLDVVCNAVDTQADSALAHKIEIVVEVPEDIELPLQRARIERVFTNLIANAIEVMPGGGRVRIAARLDGDRALVEVEDTGPGISPEIRDQLFQPFVTHGKKNGLGLGLALARQAVLEHGGDIWIDKHKTGGARFFLRFPSAARSRPACAAAQ